MIGESIIFCHTDTTHNGEPYMAHFGSEFYTRFHIREIYTNEPRIKLLKVKVTEGTDSAGYWGWWDSERKQWEYVYIKKFLVEMCFPYGAVAEESRGRGFLRPVNIEVLEEVRKQSV